MEKFYDFNTRFSLKTVFPEADLFRWKLWFANKNAGMPPRVPLSKLTDVPAGVDIDDLCKKGLYQRLIDGDYPSWLTFPVVFRVVEGTQYRDFLEMRRLYSWLISDRLKNLLEREHITGWKSYPIVLYDKKGNEVPGYHGFSITGRAKGYDNHDRYREDRMKHPMEATIRPVWNTQNWDGSDIFRITRGSLVVTERVVKILKANKIEAIHAYPLSRDVDLY